MICSAIRCKTRDAAAEGLQKAVGNADIAELRIDFSADAADWLEEVLEHKSLPVIVTDRTKAEGGASPRTDRERIALLQQAALAGAEYVDCEYSCIQHLGDLPETVTLISSFHDFDTFPPDLEEKMLEMDSGRGDIVKVAVQALDICDNFRLFDTMEKISKPVIGICMGSMGEISRILGRKYGNVLTYGSPDGEEGTAPGQVSVSALKQMYRYNEINTDTEVYGVAGDPIAHSASPDIHNAAFRSLGLNAVYVKFHVTDISLFMKCFSRYGFKGLSVTIPHKVGVMAVLDEIDDISEKAESVNTVFRKGNLLSGTNTDIRAAVDRLSELTGGLAGRKAAVLGAGGVSRGICFGLKEEGADILIVNRTVEKAERLAGNIGCGFSGYDGFDGKNVDVIINATSVGMHPDVERSPIDTELLSEEMTVFDTIYNPPETMLIREARRKGCRTLTGTDMFLAQGEKQFEIWFGRKPPEGVMEKAFNAKFTKRT